MGGSPLPWVRLPGGVYHLRLTPLLCTAACLLGAVVFLVSAVRLNSREEGPPVAPIVAHAVSGIDIFEEPEPFTALFGLDTAPSRPFVLVSTLLGPWPMATVALGESTFAVALGDTIAGLMVDSIGRRVMVLSRDGEVIRVGL